MSPDTLALPCAFQGVLLAFPMRPLFAALSLLALPLLASAGEFRGDTVLIHARPTPYTEKWAIGRNGTQAAPITVRGVPDAQGNLPIIHGEGATTRSQLNYWI